MYTSDAVEPENYTGSLRFKLQNSATADTVTNYKTRQETTVHIFKTENRWLSTALLPNFSDQLFKLQNN